MTPTALSGLPGGGRVLDLEDLLAAYDDPAVSWVITASGHLHHLTRSGRMTLCGHQAVPSSEPAHPHAVCRRCLDARVERPAQLPTDRPDPRPRPDRPARRSGPHRRVDWAAFDPRLSQCNRLSHRFWSEAFDHRGDLVWPRGTERPNVNPVAEADAWTSYRDVQDLWSHIWMTEVVGGDA